MLHDAAALYASAVARAFTMKSIKHLSLCIAAFAALTSTHSALAAERKARLTIDVQVTGDETWRGIGKSSDQAKVKVSQHLTLTTFVKSDGELVDFNPKDPNYGEQQMQKAAKVNQAVAGTKGSKAPAKTQEEMQAYLEAKAKACSGDSACLLKLSDEAAQWGAQLNGEPAEQDEASDEGSGAGQFLQYFGYSNCGATMRTQVDDTTEGSYADVNGAVPFQVKAHADYAGTKEDRELLCTQTNVVVDTQKKLIYTDGLLVFDVKGEITRTEKGKTQTIKETLPLKGEAFGWVSSQLREAPLSGKRQATITLRKPNGSNVPFSANAQGTAKIELTWRFEEV
jgi:hypothetical protein